MSHLWIVKDALEQIQGPFETSEILIQIKNGALTGDEMISSYPEGSWQQISTEPKFFDYMLAVLSGDEEEEHRILNEKESDSSPIDETIRVGQSEIKEPSDRTEQINDFLSEAEPIFPEQEIKIDHEKQTPATKDEFEIDEPSLPEELEEPKQPVLHREVKGRASLFEDRQPQTIDSLSDLRAKTELVKKNQKRLYLIAVVFCGLLAGFFLVEDEPRTKGGKAFHRFVLPEKSKKELSSQEEKEAGLGRAIKLMRTDLVPNLIEAQSLLNAVLTYEPRNKTSLLLLCSSYLRLWEHTAKSGADLYVVSEISKRAYSAGNSGDVLYVCRITEMLLRGRNAEAREAVDTYLNSEALSGETSFYLRYFKGLMLFKSADYSFATSFLESSVKIEPRWIPSLMLLGQAYIKENRSQDAYNAFSNVLRINPSHPEALFQMSILNIDVFSNFKRGVSHFNKAVSAAELYGADNYVRSEAYTVFAKALLKQGKKTAAEDLARKAFDWDPSNISAKNILIATGATTDASSADKYIIAEADSLYDEEEWKAAIALYEEVYQLNPRNGYAAMRIAECYWKQSFVTDAIKWAELAVAADPSRVESYVLLSEFLTSQYRLVDAARVLMKARAANKSSFEIYRGFARIELYRKNYKAAVRNAEQALQIYSSDVESLVIMIKSLKAMGELEKAYAHARAAKEVSKSSFDLENLYSELMMKTQGLAVAKGYIEERLRTTSGDPKYRVIMANLYLEDQQYAAAAKTAKRGNDLLDWELVEGVVTYAKALGELKKLESAVDMFEKAYLMKPTDATPLFLSGEMLLNNFKPRDAIKQFERVERANPLYPDLLYQWAKSKKMIAQKEKDAELAQEAIKLAEKELDRDPTHFESHILIAEAYYVLGNIIKEKVESTNPSDEEYSFLYSEMVSWYKLCASNYQKAIDKAVQPGDVHISMARCYRLSGSLDQARASADYAEKIDKTNPRVWLELALIHEQQGSFRLALKSYENFLLIYPNAENKKEVENRINKLKSIAEEN